MSGAAGKDPIERGEIRERLGSLAAISETTRDELSRVRGVVHELVTHQATLALMAEEARESRKGLSDKLEALGAEIDPMMVAVAQGATTVAMHVQQCTDHNAQQNQRHAENQERFARIERTIWLAAGGASVLWAAVAASLSLFGAFLKH